MAKPRAKKKRKDKTLKFQNGSTVTFKEPPPGTPPLKGCGQDFMMYDIPAPTWRFDAPSGTHRNEVLSALMRDAAADLLTVSQHARWVDCERHHGETITLTTLSPIDPPTQPLSEGGRLEAVKLQRTDIRLLEWGCSFPYTILQDDLGSFDPHHPLQRRLIERMANTEDAMVARGFTITPFKKVANRRDIIKDGNLYEQAWSGWLALWLTRKLGLDNRRGLRHIGEVGSDAVERCVEHLAENAVPAIDGHYHMLVGRKLARTLRTYCGFAPNYLWANTSLSCATTMKGEIGKFTTYNAALPDVRVIQVNDPKVLKEDEAVIFGEDAVAAVSASPFELRAAVPQDFGRSTHVAVYGIAAAGPVWQGEQSRVVHITQGDVIPTFWPQMRAALRARAAAAKARVQNRVRQGIAGFLRDAADVIDEEDKDAC